MCHLYPGGVYFWDGVKAMCDNFPCTQPGVINQPIRSPLGLMPRWLCVDCAEAEVERQKIRDQVPYELAPLEGESSEEM